MVARPTQRVLAVRLDSAGDVLLTGPALRAVAAGSSRLDLLVSPAGLAAGEQLPGVDQVLLFDAPWTGHPAPEVSPDRLSSLIDLMRARAYDHVVVFTSFHQSPLPMALLARWAGVPRVSAMSEEYPGSLLDVRSRRHSDGAADTGSGGDHEVEAALRLAADAGFTLPAGDDGSLRVKPLAAPSPPLAGAYVVVHPHASVPSRSFAPEQTWEITHRLVAEGWFVVLTGAADEDPVPGLSDDPRVTNLMGATSWPELTRLLADAACVVVGNTGPAHLAAAVGTPVVSLFSPVVPAERWRPWGVPHILLGDQEAACAGTRALTCPGAGHPCLAEVSAEDVASAVRQLAGPAPLTEHQRTAARQGVTT